MTDTERAAMIRLAGQWETAADNLEAAIAGGASRTVAEVETLRQCADELRRTADATARRTSVNTAGLRPTPRRSLRQAGEGTRVAVPPSTARPEGNHTRRRGRKR